MATIAINPSATPASVLALTPAAYAALQAKLTAFFTANPTVGNVPLATLQALDPAFTNIGLLLQALKDLGVAYQ